MHIHGKDFDLAGCRPGPLLAALLVHQSSGMCMRPRHCFAGGSDALHWVQSRDDPLLSAPVVSAALLSELSSLYADDRVPGAELEFAAQMTSHESAACIWNAWEEEDDIHFLIAVARRLLRNDHESIGPAVDVMAIGSALAAGPALASLLREFKAGRVDLWNLGSVSVISTLHLRNPDVMEAAYSVDGDAMLERILQGSTLSRVAEGHSEGGVAKALARIWLERNAEHLPEWLGPAVGMIVQELSLQREFMQRVGGASPSCMLEVVTSLADSQLGGAIQDIQNWRGAPVHTLLARRIETRLTHDRNLVYDALNLAETLPWVTENVLRRQSALMDIWWEAELRGDSIVRQACEHVYEIEHLTGDRPIKLPVDAAEKEQMSDLLQFLSLEGVVATFARASDDIRVHAWALERFDKAQFDDAAWYEGSCADLLRIRGLVPPQFLDIIDDWIMSTPSSSVALGDIDPLVFSSLPPELSGGLLKRKGCYLTDSQRSECWASFSGRKCRPRLE